MYKKRSFYQDRLGTNLGKLKKRDRFFSGDGPDAAAGLDGLSQVRFRLSARDTWQTPAIDARVARDRCTWQMSVLLIH